MKIEQVIVLHLFNKKIVTLQGIGTFRLDPSVHVPGDNEKDIIIPENAVAFEYNPKATEDWDLIDSIVQHTTKIKPLASADLDSFLMLGRQFLNIGKPFTLDRLGTLDKAQTGELVFIPGQFITPKMETPKSLKENVNEESSGLFNDYNKKPENNNKQIFAAIAGVIILGLIGWAVYHFAFSKKSDGVEGESAGLQNVMVDSSLKKDSIAKDSIAKAVVIDSMAKANEPAHDFTFKIIFDETKNNDEAVKTMNKLNNLGYHVNIYTTDSVTYKVAELFQQPLSDTSRIRDSITRLHRSPVSVELK